MIQQPVFEAILLKTSQNYFVTTDSVNIGPDIHHEGSYIMIIDPIKIYIIKLVWQIISSDLPIISSVEKSAVSLYYCECFKYFCSPNHTSIKQN